MYIVNSDTECPNLSVPNEDRRLDKSNLRLVQYNVEWLFVDYYSNFDCPGACTWSNESEALIHLDYVSKVIDKLNPDILNLCEVEGCDELNMVIDKLNNSNSYVSMLKKGTDTSTGQNVGIITKINPAIPLYRFEERYNYPIEGSMCGYTGTNQTTGVSKHYITEYKINDYNIALFGAHLIAYPTDPLRCAEREAQAQVLQSMIYSYSAIGYEVIVIGDFNDFDGVVLDLNNNIPSSQVLNILKGDFGVYKDEYKLYTATEKIAKEERYTDWYDKNLNCISDKEDFSMIDHILLSKNLYNKIKKAFIYHDYSEYCGKYDSDHFPLVIDFEF
jgi:exonuclease III